MTRDLSYAPAPPHPSRCARWPRPIVCAPPTTPVNVSPTPLSLADLGAGAAARSRSARRRNSNSSCSLIAIGVGLEPRLVAGLLRGVRIGARGLLRRLGRALARRAASATGQEALLEYLTGPTGLVWVNGDPAVAAKVATVYVNEALSAGSMDSSSTVVPAAMQRVALEP